MAEKRHRFIEGLVAEHRPQPALALPGRRAAGWFACSLVLSILLTLVVQAFRPGFAHQLLHHPVLLIEVLAAAVAAGLCGYLVLVAAIPGARVLPRTTATVLGAAGAGLVVALALGFTSLAPPASSLGARLACRLEVLVYGCMNLAILMVLARRGYLRTSFLNGAVLGFAAGLVPAAIMQLACMYSPSHGLDYHYGPVVVLVILGLLLNRALGRSP